MIIDYYATVEEYIEAGIDVGLGKNTQGMGRDKVSHAQYLRTWVYDQYKYLWETA